MLSACATTNTSNATNSSSKKETVTNKSKELKAISETKSPNKVDTITNTPSPYKTGDSRGY